MPKVFGPPRKLESQCILEDGPISTAEKKRSRAHSLPLSLPLKAQEPPQGEIYLTGFPRP